MPNWTYYTCCYFPEFFGLKYAPFGFCCKCWEKQVGLNRWMPTPS